MTNNDADQLYHRPSVIQLIQTDRQYTEILRVYGLGRIKMLEGIWVCGGVQIYGGHMAIGMYGYGVIWT